MNMKISLAEFSQKKELVDLWIETFGDDEYFVNSFIESYMIGEYNVPVALVDGKIVSTLYLIDFDLYSNLENIGVCSYLFAAATDKEYRNRGLMSRLIEYAAELCKNRGIKAIFLFPQNQSEDLFRYYAKFGFKDIYKTKKIYKIDSELEAPSNIADLQLELKAADICDVETFDELYESYIDFSVRQSLSPVKDRLFYFKCAKSYLDSAEDLNGESDKELTEENTCFAILKNNVEKFCYVFYKKSKNVYYIDDIIYIKCDKVTENINNLRGEQDKVIALLAGYIKNQGCDYEINGLPIDDIIDDISDKNDSLAMILPLNKQVENIIDSLKVPVYLNMFMN